MLRRLGLQVDLAGSGSQALAAAHAAETGGSPYDVVLIDWLMPHMDGLETARRLLAQAQGEPPKCILVSVSADARMREQALALGISCLLKKPVSYSTLNDHLMSLLAEPDAATRPGSEHAQAEQGLREAHGGATVLVAEDNPVNQDVARTLLNMAGLHADIACNGREAVEMASATAYPLILMDIQMPELDGLQAARLLRAQPAHASTPIIAMTANAHADDRAACIAAGMNDYLTKPVDAIVLYAVLRRWLSAAAPVSAAEHPGAEPRARRDGSMNGIEGLNAARGLEFLGGNEDAFRRALLTMTELYAGGLPEASAYLAQPVSPATIGPLRQALHSIGGACAALGLEPLSEGASRLGSALREAPPSGVDVGAELRAFLALLQRVLGEIRLRLGGPPGATSISDA
ncbi:MAG TPA: response regulator, partial [Burkholderiaceae bacterium]